MYLVIKKIMLRCSGTLRMKIKNTKCLAHYICSYIISIYYNFLIARCARILKVKSKVSFTL